MMKEKEEKEGKNVREDRAVQQGETSSVRSSGPTERPKITKPKNFGGRKSKTEEQMTEVEEEKHEEESVEVAMKRKVVGCINKEEAAAFQNFVRDKMSVLVERMRNDKNLIKYDSLLKRINAVTELIRY